MACYISSTKNRHYAAIESAYGQAAAVTAAERFTSLGIKVSVEHEYRRRRDKTGTRTYQGIAGGLRKQVSFEAGTYLYQRDPMVPAPKYSALIEAAMGSGPLTTSGGATVASVEGSQVTFSSPHGLQAGQAVPIGGEVRFVESVSGGSAIVVSAPFTQQIAGLGAGSAVVYPLAHDLKSATLYDYWSPTGAIQRILAGCVIDEMAIEINGDYHEMRFRGEAAEMLDNRSFQAGQAGLAAFPDEPSVGTNIEAPIPGHLGQAWFGTGPEMLHTVKSARIVLKNNVDLQRKDFGTSTPRCFAPGEREVSIELELYSQDKSVFNELYEAAQLRNALPLMLQLGNAPGQMSCIWTPAFVPEIPDFLDDEPRLRWRVRSSRAQGSGEDELHVAFA